jgi:uncharacterized protein YdaU (DUF1376 family)
MPHAPVWPFSIGDYMQDTVTLSAEEHGAYLLLLMAQWSNGGGPLPNDPDVLARICRLSKPRWTKKVSRNVLRFFIATEAGIGHARIEEDYRRVTRKIESNRVNAARGGRARARNCDAVLPMKIGDTAPLPYGISMPLDTHEARNAACIRDRIEAETATRWPDDPMPRDTRMLDADADDFARAGATVEIFDAVMVRAWPRLTRPPAGLSPYRADLVAQVRRWIAYQRWTHGGRKGSSPWRAGWGALPDDAALARFVIPAAYRKPGEAAAPPADSPSPHPEG